MMSKESMSGVDPSPCSTTPHLLVFVLRVNDPTKRDDITGVFNKLRSLTSEHFHGCCLDVLTVGRMVSQAGIESTAAT